MTTPDLSAVLQRAREAREARVEDCVCLECQLAADVEALAQYCKELEATRQPVSARVFDAMKAEMVAAGERAEAAEASSRALEGATKNRGSWGFAWASTGRKFSAARLSFGNCRHRLATGF